MVFQGFDFEDDAGFVGEVVGVGPGEDEAFGAVGFEDFADEPNGVFVGGVVVFPFGAGFPIGMVFHAAPVLACEGGIGDGVPEFFRGCFDEGFVNELGFAHINFLSLVRVVGLETFWAFRGLV